MKKFIFLLFFVCLILVGCNSGGNNGGTQETPGESEQNAYVPSESTLFFSDEHEKKIITEATFDISQYTETVSDDIKPYQIFQSGMCLQRDAVNRIWGKASKTKNIAIEFQGKVYYGIVNGREWEVYLPKMNAGGPYELTIISELGRKKLTDVYIGEVYLCSGQSNMEWRPQDAGDVLKDLYSSDNCVNDNIRMLQVGWATLEEPSTQVANNFKWTGANQNTIKAFTAVGYLFGKQMQEELDCPIGLIANPVGGSSIEFWLSDENYNKVKEIYRPYITTDVYMTPCLGYNGMLYPLTGINLRGVVWYQGESNAFGTQNYYDKALNIFMEQCREMFNNEQLSFTMCELARYEGNPYAYSVVNQKINLVVENDPYSVVARNLDLGEWKDIHPKDKREIARRAAYETLRVFFNKDKKEPIKVIDYSFNNDGSVTIELSCDANLVNGTNGFEVYVNGKYTYECNVEINKNILTITANGEILKVRYGYTCKMTEEIQNDVSKMVTVYDSNGFPLDLFLIDSTDIEVKPDPEPDPEPTPTDSPSVSVGYFDSGYNVYSEDGTQYTIEKFASAAQWTAATLSINDYKSAYSAFTIEFTTTNVTNLTIQLFVEGGEVNWSNYVSVYSNTLTDGKYTLYIDFTAVRPVDGTTWESVPEYFIKDYNVSAIVISLDTAVDAANMKNEDATCVIHSLKFDKVGSLPSDEPTDNPVDPNAPTLAIGWNDNGYNTLKNTSTGEYTIEKFASAAQWTCASLDFVNYQSAYSSFTIKFTTTNVTNLVIQLYVLGLDAGWSSYVSVYTGVVNDGTHELTIDFTEVEVVDGTTWESVSGIYIKDYDVASIKISLDTAVDTTDMVN